MAPRIQTVKKYTYHTKSNKVKRFRTPGGKLRFKKIKKSRNPVICGDTKVVLNGLKRLGRNKWKNLPKSQRTVTRTYGGCLSPEAVKHRIMRAFFNEELKCIKMGTMAPKKGGKKKNVKGKKAK